MEEEIEVRSGRVGDIYIACLLLRYALLRYVAATRELDLRQIVYLPMTPLYIWAWDYEQS